MFGCKQDSPPDHARPNEIVGVPSPTSAQEVHQAQVLADFQRATRLKETTLSAAANASLLAVEAEATYEEARKRLRRVSEGGI